MEKISENCFPFSSISKLWSRNGFTCEICFETSFLLPFENANEVKIDKFELISILLSWDNQYDIECNIDCNTYEFAH